MGVRVGVGAPTRGGRGSGGRADVGGEGCDTEFYGGFQTRAWGHVATAGVGGKRRRVASGPFEPPDPDQPRSGGSR